MTTFNKLSLTALSIGALIASTSVYANECDALLSTPSPISKKNTFVNTTEVTKTNSFNELVKNIQSKDQLRWTYSNLFFDRDVIATSALRETNSLSNLWDEPRYIFFTKSPLENFKSTYEKFILNNPNLTEEPISLELIQEFHKAMMKNGIEGIPSEKIGEIRTDSVIFYISDKQLEDTRLLLMSNPYLQVGQVDSRGRSFVEYPKAWKVKDLLSIALSKHNKALSEATTLVQRVRAHTDFVLTFVSIHPFSNGNGRTSRFILDYLLAKEGLSPPLLSDTIDLTLTEKQYFEKVVLGIKNTDLLAADLTWRMNEGLDPKQSPYNLVGKLPAKVWFSSEGTRGKKVPFPVDLYDYTQFVRDRIGNTTAPEQEIKLLKNYVQWLKDWSVHFADRAGELQLYQVKRIPNEMIELWKNKSGTSLKGKQSLQAFYKNFYETSEIHRGLSLGQTATDQELIEYFTQVKSIDVSMNASQNGGSLSSIISDFKKFNSLMNEPEKLFLYARDHMNAEGLYGESPFNSTSKLFAVADRFSRGFMMSSNWITSMKGQLVVSAYRPKFGVMDFNRLREISSKLSSDDAFKSRYPRQQEVAVAGSIHPSSITRVEFRDVVVLEAVDNSGEKIAGKTEIKLVRVLTRLPEDPSKIKLEKFDGNGVLLSQEIISLY